MYITSSIMTSGGERDITVPTVFTDQAGHAIMLMHVNLLFLPALGTVALLPLLTLCQ